MSVRKSDKITITEVRKSVGIIINKAIRSRVRPTRTEVVTKDMTIVSLMK